MTWISKISGLAKSALPAAATDGDSKNVLVDLYGRLRSAYEDLSANAMRTSEVDPISSHRESETLIDETSIAAGTTDYLYVDMEGYRYVSFQIEIAGAGNCTVTCEGSNRDDGTAAASCTYQDWTNDLFGVASITGNDTWVIGTPLPTKWLRIKYVTDTDVTDLTVYMVKIY